MKFLQGFKFSPLAVAEKSKIKNLGRAAPGLFISQSSTTVQTYVRKFNPAIYAQHMWLSGFDEWNALLSLHINDIIILVPNLPRESSTSR